MEKLAGVAVLLLCSELAVCQSPFAPWNFTERECDVDHEDKRGLFIDAARCGPRDLQFNVPTPALDISVSPQMVFVRRCVGNCISRRRGCLPREEYQLDIHVRYRNIVSGREWCAVVHTVEHKNCGCISI